MENGDLLVGTKEVEQGEMGIGNPAGEIAAGETTAGEGLATQPINGKHQIVQVGVRIGVKDGVAKSQQNVSNR